MAPSSQYKFAAVLKTVALLLAFGLLFYILSPPQLHKVSLYHSDGICPPCTCSCGIESDTSTVFPGAGFGDPIVSGCVRQEEEVDRKSVNQLTEELKLQELVAAQSEHHSNSALLEAKRQASQYQKEAEKCNSGMETCELAREKSEAALAAQKKISAMWEKRAREYGWRDKPNSDHHQSSLFYRMGLSNVKSDSFLFRKARKA